MTREKIINKHKSNLERKVVAKLSVSDNSDSESD